MKWQRISLVMFGLSIATPTYAYWSKTHQQFAQDAYAGINEMSGIEKTESMVDYYTNHLGFPLNNYYIFDNIEEVPATKGFLTWTFYNRSKRGTDIFIQGSDDEDLPTPRATNHFFDPAHDQSLRQSIEARKEYKDQFDDYSARFEAAEEEAIKTPDWALEDNFEAPSKLLNFNEQTGDYELEERQRYSLRDSYDYLYTALTATDLETRKKKMGAHVYALGHVIRLLTDMGQPEHVRNNVHLASTSENDGTWRIKEM